MVLLYLGAELSWQAQFHWSCSEIHKNVTNSSPLTGLIQLGPLKIPKLILSTAFLTFIKFQLQICVTRTLGVILVKNRFLDFFRENMPFTQKFYFLYSEITQNSNENFII